jgi:hypothetical protein
VFASLACLLACGLLHFLACGFCLIMMYGWMDGSKNGYVKERQGGGQGGIGGGIASLV